MHRQRTQRVAGIKGERVKGKEEGAAHTCCIGWDTKGYFPRNLSSNQLRTNFSSAVPSFPFTPSLPLPLSLSFHFSALQ